MLKWNFLSGADNDAPKRTLMKKCVIWEHSGQMCCSETAEAESGHNAELKSDREERSEV